MLNFDTPDILDSCLNYKEHLNPGKELNFVDLKKCIKDHAELLFSTAVEGYVKGFARVQFRKDDKTKRSNVIKFFDIQKNDFLDDLAENTARFYSDNLKTYNVDILPCSLFSNENGQKSNIQGSGVFLLDFDKGDIKDNVAKTIDFLGLPNAIIASGGGVESFPSVHLYYKFDRHLVGEDFKKLMFYRKEISKVLSADTQFGVYTQNIRVVGTANIKYDHTPICTPIIDPISQDIRKFEDFCVAADKFLERTFKKVEKNNVKPNVSSSIKESEVDHIIKCFDIAAAKEYCDWYKFGAGLHDWDNGELGLSKFITFSEKDARYNVEPKFNEQAVRDQWIKYRNNLPEGEKVTMNTIKALFRRQTDNFLDSILELPIYEQQSKAKYAEIKERLGVTTNKIVDEVLKNRRIVKEINDESKKIISLTDEVYKGEVDAVNLLNEIHDNLNKYLTLPPHAATVMTVWVLYSYLIDVIYVMPYLCINAPEKQCGKSLVLEVLSKLAKKSYITTKISAATLYRFMEQYKPTLLIDEADTFIKSDPDMQNALNAGYIRGNCALKTSSDKDHKIEKFDASGAKVITAINAINVLPDTVIDRSIIIKLKKKTEDEKTVRYRRQAINNPNHPIYKSFAIIRSKLLKLAEDIKERVEDKFLDVNFFNTFDVYGVSDRMKDNWEPLLVIASIIGGDWYTNSLKAFDEISKIEIPQETIHSNLLCDIYKLVKGKLSDKVNISTKDLIKELCESLPDSNWNDFKFGKPLNEKDLNRLLGFYELKSRKIHNKCSKDFRGFYFKDFEDCFNRYCSRITKDDIEATFADGDPDDDNDPSGGGTDEPEDSAIEDVKVSNNTDLVKSNILVLKPKISSVNEAKEVKQLYSPGTEEKVKYVVRERASLISDLKSLEKSETYGLDIETTGLNATDSTIALIQIYNPVIDKAFIYKIIEAPLIEEEKQLLSELNFVAHNASFERSFMPYLKYLNCSMIAYHATTSNSRCGLSDVSSEVGITYNNKKDMQTSDWSCELTEEQLEYAAKDAKATYLLWEKYKNENKPVYDRMYKASFIIDDYSKRGLPVDMEALKTLRIETESKRDGALQKLKDKGYAHIRTAKSFTTKPNVMDNLPKDIKVIVTEIRRCDSFLNNSIKGVEDNIVNGRLPINAKICGTETGRLSTVKPNMQNFPRSGFRHIFKASKDHMFLKVDFAAQELRMAAAFSGEIKMLAAFNNGKDLHALMAANLNKMTIEDFMAQPKDWIKSERQKAKAVNFGFLYGMGAEKFVIKAKDDYNLDISLGDAKKFQNIFWSTYPILRKWCERERLACGTRGYALTKGGRKRFFDNSKDYYSEKINTAVQGSCAEVLLETLFALPDDLKGYLVNTVHDELVFEVPTKVIEDEVEYDALEKAIIKAVEDAVLKIEPRYPLRGIVEIKKVKTLG